MHCIHRLSEDNQKKKEQYLPKDAYNSAQLNE